MRSLGVFMGAVFVLTGCLKADVNYYQPPCTNTEDCPFDWACVENRCISPETSEAYRPQTQKNEDAGSIDGAIEGNTDGNTADAGSTDGGSDGTIADAGSTDGGSDGTTTDAGSTDGGSDGTTTDAGSTLTCDDLNCGTYGECVTTQSNEPYCDCDNGYENIENICTMRDYDGDDISDLEDPDDDNDELPDNEDSCAIGGDLNWTSRPATDRDADGCQDSGEDTDDDNDGISDSEDLCPRGMIDWASDISNDADGDGCHNDEDFDLDNDWIYDQDQEFFSRDYQLVAAGPTSLCALHNADIIHCIAQENPGLTDNSTPYMLTPFDQIELTSDTYVALDATQSIVCHEDYHCPPATDSFLHISAGYATACAVRASSAAHCWDLSTDEAVQSPIVTQTPTGSFLEVKVGREMACGIQSDKTVVCWGDQNDGTNASIAPPSDDGEPFKFTSLSVGVDFACGITDAHKIKCWPEDKIPNGPSVPDGDFRIVTAGASHFCTRGRGNNVVSCQGLSGLDEDEFPIPTMTPYQKMVSGINFSCGLKPGSGAVECWGGGLAEIGWGNLPVFPMDNCPNVANPDQADEDENTVGDVCEGCTEGLFFSRYVTQSQAQSHISGSNGGALAIYNPTSQAIHLGGYTIHSETGALNLQDLEFVSNNLSLGADESYVICRKKEGSGVFSWDDACNAKLNGVLQQDLEDLFTGSHIRLTSNEQLVDIIGPSVVSPDGGGIWLESPVSSQENQFHYLKRSSTVTRGAASFELWNWEQAHLSPSYYTLDNLGFSNAYAGCQ